MFMSFFGSVNLADSQKLLVRLYPNQPVYDLTNPTIDFISKIDVGVTAANPSDGQIGKLELQGGVTGADWTIILNELPWDAFVTAGQWWFTTRSLGFCSPASGSESPLLLGIQPVPSPSPAPSPARHRKKP